MKKYLLCAYCGEKKGPTSAPYCSNECKRQGHKKFEELMSKSPEVGEMLRKLKPMPYTEVLGRVEVKYGVNPYIAGNLLSKAYRERYFQCYPRKQHNSAVFTKSEHYEEARAIYRKLLADDGVTYDMMKYAKEKHYKIAKKLRRLWDKGLNVPEIHTKTGYKGTYIKKCIGELNG